MITEFVWNLYEEQKTEDERRYKLFIDDDGTCWNKYEEHLASESEYYEWETGLQLQMDNEPSWEDQYSEFCAIDELSSIESFDVDDYIDIKQSIFKRKRETRMVYV